jgi:hypothetical protein
VNIKSIPGDVKKRKIRFFVQPVTEFGGEARRDIKWSVIGLNALNDPGLCQTESEVERRFTSIDTLHKGVMVGPVGLEPTTARLEVPPSCRHSADITRIL